MKQGRASYDAVTGTKQEPVSKAVDPGAVGRLGNMEVTPQGYVVASPLYEGRGLEAPMKSQTTHKGGSQGEY